MLKNIDILTQRFTTKLKGKCRGIKTFDNRTLRNQYAISM
jgi:hypothetical protein